MYKLIKLDKILGEAEKRKRILLYLPTSKVRVNQPWSDCGLEIHGGIVT